MFVTVIKRQGAVAKWLSRRTSDPKIEGSSPFGVEMFLNIAFVGKIHNIERLEITAVASF